MKSCAQRSLDAEVLSLELRVQCVSTNQMKYSISQDMPDNARQAESQALRLRGEGRKTWLDTWKKLAVRCISCADVA